MVRTFPPWYCLSTSSTSSDIVKQCQCQTSRTANSVNCQMVHVNFKLPVIGIMTWGALWVLCNHSRPVIYPGVQASCFEKHVFWPLPFYTWHCQHLLWKWRIRCSHEIDPTTKQILSWRLFTYCWRGESRLECFDWFFQGELLTIKCGAQKTFVQIFVNWSAAAKICYAQ